jgi:hypothetical protein
MTDQTLQDLVQGVVPQFWESLAKGCVKLPTAIYGYDMYWKPIEFEKLPIPSYFDNEAWKGEGGRKLWWEHHWASGEIGAL